jgi:hypothetical protein
VEEQVSATSSSEDNMSDRTIGRRVFHWVGIDRNADVAALTAAVAETVPGLCERSGSVARLTENGELEHVNLDRLRQLIGQSLCGVRVVPNGSKFQRDFFTFEFAPVSNPGPRTAAMGLQRATRSDGPDEGVLREILQRLPQLLPRVIE